MGKIMLLFMAATTAFTQAVTTSIMSWSTLELLVVNLTTFDKCHASSSSVYKCPKVVGPLYLLSLFNILKNLTLFCPVLWKHKIYCVILLPAVLGDFMGLRSLERWRWLKLNSLSGLLLPLPLLSPQLGPRRWPVPAESSGLLKLSQYLSSRK